MQDKPTPPTTPEKADPRYWVLLTVMYLLMVAALMLPAWDWRWWQGWLFSAIILVIGIGSRVVAERRHPGLIAERSKFGKGQNVKPWDRVLAPLMAFTISFPLFITAGLDHHFGWSSTLPLWVHIVGFILITVGYLFASWAIAENEFFSTMTRIQTDRGHQVCDTGPYRIVRHPGYAGNILPLVGIAMALNSLWTLLPALLALVVIVVRTALEDRTLMKELEGYGEYAQQVKWRLVVGVY